MGFGAENGSEWATGGVDRARGVGSGARGRGSAWQPALPPLRLAIGGGGADFAHPAEDDFARLLSYYGVRWVYEPTTFALAWAEDGRPSQMFTPDFYLPEQRLYVELTTMRQRLVTRKNRKLRRLRELYPNVRIKLLYRRDYLRLLDAYACPARPAGPCRVGRVLFPAEAILDRVEELAAAVAAGADEASPLLAIGVGRGSDRFLDLLRRGLLARGVAVETDRVELSRHRTFGGARRVRVRRGPIAAVAGRRILLVEDIVSTGLSLAYLANWLGRRGAEGIEICALLDRWPARLVEVPVRYVGFAAPADLLVGFGLNLRRQFRDLPYIAAVEPL